MSATSSTSASTHCSPSPLLATSPCNTLALLPHQVKVVQWAREREASAHHGVKGGIIYLYMGLGKTPIGLTIAHDGFNLIVVPKPLMGVWKEHSAQWFPERRVLFFHKEFISATHFDKMSYSEFTSYDMVVTTYDVVSGADRKYKESDSICIEGTGRFVGKTVEIICRRAIVEDDSVTGDRLLYKVKWTRIITDESHRFSNYSTKIYRALMAIYAPYRWVMTGTIVRNKESDLWSLLRFTGYDKCPSASQWTDKEYRLNSLSELIIQMDYADANIVLPKRFNHIEEYLFSLEEQKAYKAIESMVIRAYNGMMLGNIQFIYVLVLFTRLRQMCIASHMITPESKRHYRVGASPVDEQADSELNLLTDGLNSWVHQLEGTAGIQSSKMNKMLEIIAKIPADEKILVASSFTSALDIAQLAIEGRFGAPAGLSEELLSRGSYFTTVMIDGDTKNRDAVIARFKNDPNCRVLLMSFRVGGEGFTLTNANHVIELEPWWTGAVMDQLASRVHRYGQNKECHIWSLLAKNTIETNMVMTIVKGKRSIRDKYFAPEGASDSKTKAPGLDKAMLGKLLFGQNYNCY